MPLPVSTLVDVGLFCLICATLYGLFFRRYVHATISLPYPPGPPESNRILGSISDMPLEEQWLVFSQWKTIYGNIVHLRVVQQHFVILNSLETAVDILEKRSHNYSSRAQLPMIDLMGWDIATTVLPYGNEWRKHRRIFRRYFNSTTSLSYRNIQARKVHDMLSQLVDDPDDLFSHIRHASGAIIMSTVYGHDVQGQEDYFVAIAERALDDMAKALMPGAFLVNVFPVLRHIPAWLPWAGFKRFAQETKSFSTRMLNEPFQTVQDRMVEGEVRSCIAVQMLEHHGHDFNDLEELEDFKRVCLTAYGGGSETTVSSTETFFYAMANFPSIQKRAQEEIDRVIGRDRLPNFADRPSLPYCEALMREVFRWRPVLPVGVAHQASDDDVYKEYFIPKGTLVIPNVWAMTRDPLKYTNADDFDPSRFFTDHGSLNGDDVGYTFGFGRRICPGRYFGIVTVWFSIVSVLATFDIRKKENKDGDGRDNSTDTGYTKAFLIHPLPFECSIKPRSESAKALIQAAIAHRDN